MVTAGDDGDGDTQALETGSPPSDSEVRFKDMWLNGSSVYETLQDQGEVFFKTELAMEAPNLDGETQVVEDTQCIADFYVGGNHWEETQVMDDHEEIELVDGDDNEGSERTQVLSDDDGLSDDGTCYNIERKIEGDLLDPERRKNSLPPSANDHDKKDSVVDFDASTDEEGGSGHVSLTILPSGCSSESNPGSARRSFTAVRAASLRASGLAAARSMIPKITDNEPNFLSNGQSCKQSDNVITAQPSVKRIEKDITSAGESTSIPGTKVCELHPACTTNSHKGMQYNCYDKAESRIRNPRARRLFYEDAAAGKEKSPNEIGSSTGKEESPRPLVYDSTVGGLSYVCSQEPGEQSQANALDVVDKFLSINDVGTSQDAVPGKTPEVKSPPVSSVKGAQWLAKSVGQRSPVGKAGIFDWVDSLEDECGGEFFRKRKYSFFECSDHVKKSHSQPPKRRQISPEKTRDAFGKGGKKKSINLKIHSKVKSLTCSDSRLNQYSSISSDKLQISEVSTKKNFFNEMGEQSNAKSTEKQPEAADVGRCVEDVCDVGPDTQLAAEAMEALVCGSPTYLESQDAHPITGNLTEGPTQSLAVKKFSSEHVSLQKRASSASDSEGIMRQSEQMKMLDTKSIRGNSSFSRKQLRKPRVKKNLAKDSAGRTKEKIEKWNLSEYPSACKSVDEKELSDGKFSLSIRRKKAGRDGQKSYTSVKRQKEGRMMNRTCIKELDGYHGPPRSNGTLSFSKEPMQGEHIVNVTPVAHRTRHSKRAKIVESAETLSYYCGQATNDLTELNTIQTKGICGKFLVDSLRQSTDGGKCFNLGSNQVIELEKDVQNHEEARKINPLIKDASSHPKKRTRQITSGNSNDAVYLNDPSLLGDVVVPDTGKRITRSVAACLTSEAQRMPSNSRKVSTSGVRTRPSMKTYPHEHKYNEILNRQILFEPGSSSTNFSTASMNEKLSLNDMAPCTSVTPMCSVENQGAHSTFQVEDALSERSPKEKLQPSGSTFSTPLNEINTISPVCTGVDPLKLLHKQGSSRSSIAREFIRLEATDTAPVPVLKESRRRRDMACVHVLFSHHLGDDIIKQQKKILARLGVSIASSISDATHFIADEFVRTRNMLEAIAMGKPVVTHLWLESCGQASCFIDEKNYILKDLKKEKEVGFSMQVSLSRACQSPLLQGRRVYITPNIKPGRELMASLVKAAHGQPVERIGRSAIKDDKVPDDLLVISCEEDYAICTPLLEKGAEVFSSELLLNGIVIQKLEYGRHRIFLDNIKKTRSTIWLRSEIGNRFLPVTKCT